MIYYVYLVAATYSNMQNNGKITRILLAEDDSDDRELFYDALAAIASDVTLVSAENGIEALNLLAKGNLPDLVFLDLNMPRKNGYECLHEIKQNDALKHLPVIIFSTSLQPETAEAVYNDGASLYLVKPNSYMVLKTLLNKVLSVDWKAQNPEFDRDTFILQA